MTRLFIGAVLWTAPAWCQPVMPSWLANYPGATAQTTNSPALVEVTYATAAPPAAVQDHYRKLFESRNLPFNANQDGVGIVVRASAECDLMITVRAAGGGSAVRVSCADNSAPSSLTTTTTTTTVVRNGSPARGGMTPAQSQQQYQDDVAKAMAMHQRAVEEMGLHKVRPPAPAPPLVWPKWLVAPKDSELMVDRGRDAAGNGQLKSRFITGAPMTALYTMYKDLLASHGYSQRGGIETGHTQSGIQQNHLGSVEGDSYSDGFPGPRSEISVRFSRMYLNDPITVDIKVTVFAYAGSGPREP